MYIVHVHSPTHTWPSRCFSVHMSTMFTMAMSSERCPVEGGDRIREGRIKGGLSVIGFSVQSLLFRFTILLHNQAPVLNSENMQFLVLHNILGTLCLPLAERVKQTRSYALLAGHSKYVGCHSHYDVCVARLSKLLPILFRKVSLLLFFFFFENAATSSKVRICFLLRLAGRE